MAVLTRLNPPIQIYSIVPKEKINKEPCSITETLNKLLLRNDLGNLFAIKKAGVTTPVKLKMMICASESGVVPFVKSHVQGLQACAQASKETIFRKNHF